MRTQSTCGLLALQSWRQDRMVLGREEGSSGPMSSAQVLQLMSETPA